MTHDITQISKKFSNKDGVKIVTNYQHAVNWLHNHRVLCNHITEIDSSVYDNARFDWTDFNDDGTESDDLIQIYQWFITDCSTKDIEYLESRFRLMFTYSSLLDCYILCVPHYDTSWDYVYCDDSEKDDYWSAQRVTG